MPRAEPPLILADNIYEIPTCDIIPTSNDTNELKDMGTDTKELKDLGTDTKELKGSKEMNTKDKGDSDLDKPLLREPDMNRTATSHRDDEGCSCDSCCSGGGDDDLCLLCCICCWICGPQQ